MFPNQMLQNEPTLWWVGMVLGFVLVPICYAIGMYYLAPRMNAKRPLWVILALIPFVNNVFQVYVVFRVVFVVLDHLAEIKALLARRSAVAAGEQ